MSRPEKRNRIRDDRAARWNLIKGNGGGWFGFYADQKAEGRGASSRQTSSNSPARKAASAQIAKIPFPLARHIAHIFKP